MYSSAELIKILNIRLSKKRFTHSLNVANQAKSLAEYYTTTAPEKAYIAGLLHDICKECPVPEQLAFAKKCGRDITEVELMTAPLLHAPAAAYYIDTVLGIHDEDILNAVRYHTVGRAGMSPLEEIIYIADLTSADRNYKDVNRMRKIAYQSVSKCMIEALKFYISDVVGKNSQFSHHPIDAYNYYISNKNIQETT